MIETLSGWSRSVAQRMTEQITKREAARAHREFLEAIPWVARLKRRGIPCDGVRWSLVSCNRSKDQALCTKYAVWHFRSLKKSWARTGNYCWHHLWAQGFYGDQVETYPTPTLVRPLVAQAERHSAMTIIACTQDDICPDECLNCGGWIGSEGNPHGVPGPMGRYCSEDCAAGHQESLIDNYRVSHLYLRDLMCECEICTANGLPSPMDRAEYLAYQLGASSVQP